MPNLNLNYKNIGKILSLMNPREKDLVSRLKKELFQIRKATISSSVDDNKNNEYNPFWDEDEFDEAPTTQRTSTNLYGESNNVIDETSGMAGGAVAGNPGEGAWKKGGELTEEEEQGIMGAVEKVFSESKFFNAFYVRQYVRNQVDLIMEEQQTVTVNKLTGMNKLEKFLKQNVKTIKEAYMDLTTDKAQRVSFKAHLLNLLSALFENLFINDVATKTQQAIQQTQGDPLQEGSQINFEIDDHGGDDGKIVDLDGDGKPDQKEEHPTIEGMDPTGKREAVLVYNKLEKQIADPENGIFANLGNDLDKKVFAKWSLINLSKHMDKWESIFDNQQSNDSELDLESDIEGAQPEQSSSEPF